MHDPARQVARFHEEGTRTRMIAINNRSVYYQLARALGADRPFIDIQTYHPDGPLDLSGYSFEDFATYAVRLIRWAQPSGPYLLGGHCVYGALAFEAARQLQRMGEKIELVCLFDTWAPGYRETDVAQEPGAPPAAAPDARPAPPHRAVPQGRDRPEGSRLAADPAPSRLPTPAPSPPRPTCSPDAGSTTTSAKRRPVIGRRRPPSTPSSSAAPRRCTAPLFDERMGWGTIVAGKLYQTSIDSAHLDMFQEKPAAAIASFLGPLLSAIEGRRGA